MSDEFIDQLIADAVETEEVQDETSSEEVIEEPSQAEQEEKEPKAAETEPETEAEEAQEATEEEGEGDSQEPSEVDKIKESMQARINRQTAANHQSKRKIQEQDARIAELEAKLNSKREVTEEAYDTQEEFEAAKLEQDAEALAEQKYQEKVAKDNLEREQKEMAQKEQAFREREAEFSKDIPDYSEKVAVLNEYVATADKNTEEFQAFRLELLNSPDLPALSYHLGSNPEIIESFFHKSPDDIRIDLRILAKELSAPKKPEALPVEPKPAPPKPVGGTAKTKTPLHKQEAGDIVKWALS